MFPPVMGPVTVRRPGGRDRYGDPLPPTEHEQPGCAWAPRSADEDNDLQRQVITGYWLFAPFDADIYAYDQVIIGEVVDTDGTPIVWQVDGEPGRWRSAWRHTEVGLQVALTRAAG